MSKQVRISLFLLSVAFNLAFICTWAAIGLGRHAYPNCNHLKETVNNDSQSHSSLNDHNNQNDHTDHFHNKEHIHEHLAAHSHLHDILGVNKSQRDEIKPQLVKFYEATEQVGRDFRELRLEMIALLFEDNIDQARLKVLRSEILNHQQQLLDIIIQQIQAEKDVLNDQQQKELYELMLKEIDMSPTDPVANN